ncbi:unnamed protein product [Rotaria sp. Silwood2]|nr:unnamed protein product [Rotaria sp. Silwood2]
MGDYLGLSCFIKERNRCMIDEQKDMDIDDNQGSLNYDNLDSGSDNQQNSPIDDEYVRIEQEDAKLKLNQVLDRNTKQIDNAVDETYFKLKECSNILLSRSRHTNEPRTLSSLDLSIDDAIGILDRLRELFSISNNKEQQRLMTKLPPEWDRDRISDWLRGSQHQARKSIELQTTTGDFSYPEDRRGNKPLDNQIELAVYNFYTCDEISCETSYKQQVIHPPPFRTPIPLRFLHLTIGKTFEQFTMKYPNMEIDKYNIHNLAHHHQDFQIEASWSFSSSGHGKGPCDGLGAVVKTTATQQLLKGRPNASFSTPKQFFERCLEKNDRMVVARSRRMEASNGPSTYMPDLNSPIEVRWLSAAIINNEFENRFSTAL